ncbi:hypothetical protein NHJ13734_004916 [Beauveria thailandica]
MAVLTVFSAKYPPEAAAASHRTRLTLSPVSTRSIGAPTLLSILIAPPLLLAINSDVLDATRNKGRKPGVVDQLNDKLRPNAIPFCLAYPAGRAYGAPFSSSK